MDLVSVDPQLDLYDERWPIRTYQPNYPPPKFVFADPDRCGRALDSIVCLGCIISGGLVQRSILGPKTRINSYAEVIDSILLGEVNIGRYARIRRAIIDKGVSIPPGMEVGFDPELDARRGFFVTDQGITVITPTDSLELMEELAHRTF
jgi:glucose-1-phosphate adenylyltransferase